MARPRERSSRQKLAHRLGVRAEWLAAVLLRMKGYRILETRYRVPVGEIDIIARRRGTVIFCEVKQRPDAGAALEALRPAQRLRIVRAAEQWLHENGLPLDSDCRFDMLVFSAYLVPRHIRNAFTLDGI
ncbi:MAG: YraN family protein [Pseudomonadota bacterium]